MTGRTVLPISIPISIFAALLMFAATMPQAAAQAVAADETHGAAAGPMPRIALDPAQKRAIYAHISRQRLRTSAADIPLTVGAAVPRSAALLTLPDRAPGKGFSSQDLKYAMVDNDVVLVDPISMRVIDIIRGDRR